MCIDRDRPYNLMRLGDVERFDVWFLPNRENYSPRVVAGEFRNFGDACAFVEHNSGMFNGSLEIVRTTTRRQRVVDGFRSPATL